MIKSLFWSFTDSYGIYAIRFFFSIAIARYVLPEEFGLIAMIMMFTELALLFSEGGFGAALIQKRDANNIDFSTAFTFNLSLALIFYLVLFFSAPFIADFYDQSQLDILVKVIGIQIIINVIGYIHHIKLIKQLKIKQIAFSNGVSSIIGGGLGVFFAWKGYGVWAIVIQLLVSALVKSFMLISITKFIPTLIINEKSFKEQFNFGYKIYIQGFLDVVFSNLYALIIGKIYSAGDLGFYARGRRFHSMFVNQMGMSFRKVFYSSFSNVSDDFNRLKKNYLLAYEAIIISTFPFFIFLILIMKPFVLFFLTEVWLPSVIYIQLFLIEGFLLPLFVLNMDIINATGKSNITLKINVLKKILTIVIIVFTYKYGIITMIIGWVVASVMSLIYSELVIKKMNINSFSKLRALLPSIIVCSLSLALGGYIGAVFSNFFIIVILNLLSIATIFIVVMKIFKLETFIHLKSLITKKIK